jgi:capsular exopolysaccharide synthesis family protein
LGFFLALALIYLRKLLNNKITSKEDLSKIPASVLGHISHISGRKKEVISVLGRNLAAEEFRAIRTNLSYLLKNKNEKIVLITSSSSNEGKSFISLNLAAVCAIPGKKVALLEFDIRNPMISERLQIESSVGLTNYLAGKTNLLSEICYSLEDIPTMDVFPAGAVNLNPADILLSENIDRLFKELKENYDCIIVDSPPLTLVSDGFILGRYADMVIFIIRQGFTLKNQIDFIREAITNKRLPKLQLLFNDKKSNNNSVYSNYYNYERSQETRQKKSKSLAS